MSQMQKEQTLLLKLKEHLRMIFPTFTLTESLGSDGAKLLISADSTPAAGEQVMAIRIKKNATDFTDSVGLTQKIYAPLMMQVIEESSSVAGLSILTAANKARLDSELAKMGVTEERYLNANTTAVTLAQFASDGTVSGSTKVADVRADVQWPLSGQ